MKNSIENIAKLIKVKTIVTFGVLAVYMVLALKGIVPSDNVQNVTLMVIAFYFGTQSEKKGGGE